ncbi:MAG: DUF3800 domain-containing protein [Sedimentibacter sp.]|nr:DUF3800 domain-containing protein [Sedimentibacter sp.]
MDFEIYCDESHPDCFGSKSDARAKYLLIGSLWLPKELRNEIKSKLIVLKEKHNYNSEIKWHKISSKNKENFYKEIINLFIEYGEQLRFRCIAINSEKINLVKFHQEDGELAFYKFYYQLLKNWILDFNNYVIFCDTKTNRDPNRLKTLCKCLGYSNLTSNIKYIQALPSKEAVMIQFVDFLLGCASARLNNNIKKDGIKDRITKHLEQNLKIQRIKPTYKTEQKYNVFKIKLDGGW